MSQDPPPAVRQPIFNIPPMTKALLVANCAVHALRMLLPQRLDLELLINFAFIPARYSEAGTAGWPSLGWPAAVAPITFQFLHANLAHLGINMLALLAFGTGVERRIGSWRMLVFALICGVASAAAHFAVYPHSADPVIGASGAISGLFAGVLRFGIARGSGGRLWPLIVLWLIISIVAGVTGLGAAGEAVAWVAHIGGFLAGLLLFGWFDRKPRAFR